MKPERSAPAQRTDCRIPESDENYYNLHFSESCLFLILKVIVQDRVYHDSKKAYPEKEFSFMSLNPSF